MARFFFILLLIASTHQALNAQKKAISQARSYVKSGSNLQKAEQMMEELLADSANRGNKKVWLTRFDAVEKQWSAGNEKLYLKQKYDTAEFFNLTQKMFRILEGLDSVESIPDHKGRVRMEYRKKHAGFLDGHRRNLFNGGMFFVSRRDYKSAYSFFDDYIGCAYQPLFSGYGYAEKDTLLPRAGYWAAYCGYKMGDTKATLHHTYLALKDTSKRKPMLQYLAETYKAEGDTARYLGTLREGFADYPTFTFFFSRLVRHFAAGQDWKEVLAVSEEALQADSASHLFLFSKSGALLNMGRYGECIAICDSLIARGDSVPEVYLNAGLGYFNQAVDIEKDGAGGKKARAAAAALFRKSLPYIETYRRLAPEADDKWGLPLYTIYLNLNMGREFDEMDRIVRGQK